MERSKWQLILHDKQEDPYYEITNGPISLSANCGYVGETEAEEQRIFEIVTETLNNSRIDFWSENPLELTQHIEIQKLGYENSELQAKCERYEKALQSIVTPNLYSPDTWDEIADKMIRTAAEALAGEGEKEVRDDVWKL